MILDPFDSYICYCWVVGCAAEVLQFVMSRDNPFDMQIKLLMIGDSGVGKTCLLLRYANDSFSPTFITTIGIDFKIKNIQMYGKRIKLQVSSIVLMGNRCCDDIDIVCTCTFECLLVDMGYCWPGEIPNHHYIIFPWSTRHYAGVRYHGQKIIYFTAKLDSTNSDGRWCNSFSMALQWLTFVLSLRYCLAC